MLWSATIPAFVVGSTPLSSLVYDSPSAVLALLLYSLGCSCNFLAAAVLKMSVQLFLANVFQQQPQHSHDFSYSCSRH